MKTLYCITDALGNPVPSSFCENARDCVSSHYFKGRYGSVPLSELELFWQREKSLGYNVVEISFPTLPLENFPHKVVDVTI